MPMDGGQRRYENILKNILKTPHKENKHQNNAKEKMTLLLYTDH